MCGAASPSAMACTIRVSVSRQVIAVLFGVSGGDHHNPLRQVDWPRCGRQRITGRVQQRQTGRLQAEVAMTVEKHHLAKALPVQFLADAHSMLSQDAG